MFFSRRLARAIFQREPPHQSTAVVYSCQAQPRREVTCPGQECKHFRSFQGFCCGDSALSLQRGRASWQKSTTEEACSRWSSWKEKQESEERQDPNACFSEKTTISQTASDSLLPPEVPTTLPQRHLLETSPPECGLRGHSRAEPQQLKLHLSHPAPLSNSRSQQQEEKGSVVTFRFLFCREIPLFCCSVGGILSFRAGKAQQQEGEALGGIAFGVRKQRRATYKPSKPDPKNWHFH